MSVAAPAKLTAPDGLELGSGLELRVFDERDASELHALVVANREHLERWLPWAPTQSFEGTLEFIRRGRRQLADRQGCQLAIVRHARIAGTIGYHRIDWANGATSLGYWLAKDAERQGTMTAAVAALVDHAFGPWRLNRLEIRAGTENQRSRAIPERLGFVCEGVLREAERIGERYVDHVVYAILARDWRRPA